MADGFINPEDQKLCDGCRRGDLAKVTEALKNGANPTVTFRLALGTVTPIFLSAKKGHVEIAKLLTKYVNVSSQRMDFDKTTLLHHAASNDQAVMCEFLISQGCDVDAKDVLGRTPLMDAAEVASVECVRILTNNNANVNMEDKEGSTALSYCIDGINGTEANAAFLDSSWELIKAGANANYAGKYGSRTLLHCVCAIGDFEKVKLLCEDYNALVLVYDNDSKLPIDYARDKELTQIVEFLEEKQRESMSRTCLIL